MGEGSEVWGLLPLLYVCGYIFCAVLIVVRLHKLTVLYYILVNSPGIHLNKGVLAI